MSDAQQATPQLTSYVLSQSGSLTVSYALTRTVPGGSETLECTADIVLGNARQYPHVQAIAGGLREMIHSLASDSAVTPGPGNQALPIIT